MNQVRKRNASRDQARYWYQEIHRFPMLVNKCRIFDEDNRARSAHYKSLNEKKGKNQYRGKSFSAPANKRKQKASYEKRTSGG